MRTINVTAHSPADAASLYKLLTDGASWPTWSPIDSFRLEKAGACAPEGVSAIRVFRTGLVTSREEITELVPGRRLGYRLLSGLPLRGYRATVELTPAPAGTDIRWHSSFTARLPGTGLLYQLFLSRFIQRCADGLAAHAAR